MSQAEFALQIEFDQNGNLTAVRYPDGQVLTEPSASFDEGFILSGVNIFRIEELSVIGIESKDAQGNVVRTLCTHHRCRYYCPIT